ncbi:MAG TPA: tetratricopeptide repeat protein [Planctomycetota bacterium]|nr:tetratricopeptide repeat protein [Planctomycetota bacterium]
MDRKTRARRALALLLLASGACASSSPMRVGSERLNRAEAALARGRAGEAISMLDGNVGDSIRGSKLLGRAYLDVGDPERARENLARALRIDPSDPETYRIYGEACERDRFFDRAIDSYRRALAVRHDDADAARRLAVLLADLGRSAEAAEALREAARLLPDDLEIRHRLGVVELERGRDEEAESAFDLVLARGGPSAPAFLGRGVARARRFVESRPASGPADGLASAEADFLEAMRLAVDDPAPPYDLGWVRELRADRAGAEDAYRFALERDPNHLQATLRLAVLLDERRALPEALVLYRRAQAATSDPRIKKALADRVLTLERGGDPEAPTDSASPGSPTGSASPGSPTGSAPPGSPTGSAPSESAPRDRPPSRE